MLLPTELSIEHKFANSAATVALHNFYWHYATLVLFNSSLITADIFLQSYQKKVFVGHGTYYPGFVKRVRQYVLFGADLPDIVGMLTWMQKHQFDNTGTYIVVCQSKQWDECQEDDLVDMLWNYKIINVVLINKRRELNGFTYHYPEDCKNPRPINVESWNSCLLNGYKYCQNMYPLKLKNLHQCPIIVSTFNQVPYMNISDNTPTGSDGDLLRLIANVMNISLVVMTPRTGNGWGIVQENGSWTGSLADVYYDWANFSMTFGCITMSRFSAFQISTNYAFITIAWVTHPSKMQPSSLKLFRPFQPYVQIALVISFVMVILFKVSLKSNFLSSLGRELNITLPNNIIFHSWELCMGLPIRTFPTNQALLCLAVIWIWYCFLLRTLYQVDLINSLQTDVYDPEFDTIEEAIASEYTFGGGLPLRDYYINNALVFDGWTELESIDIHPTMVKLSQGLKFVLAMNLETTKVFLSSNPDKKLHILPQVIITSPTGIFFKKYSPLANSFNIILSRLQESGIIQKIYEDHTGKKVLKETSNDNIPIAMVQYTGCYAILLIGWLLSSLCFVIEKVMHRKKSTS